MPEEANYQSNQTESFSKLLFQFEYGEADGTQDKLSRSTGALKSDKGYDLALSSKPPAEFIKTAGCDLSAIFMPFRVASGLTPNMPTVSVTEESNKQLPFQMDFAQSDTLVNRYIGPSGDSLKSVVSSDKYYGDVNQLRDAADVRSVGFRMPMMGVGWGRDLEGAPWPSGTAEDEWMGDHKHGSLVDPRNYVAAPVDFRYNKIRNLWNTDSTQILIKNNTGGSVAKYSILGISDSIFDPSVADELDNFQSDIILIGEDPLPKHWGNFAIVSQGMQDQEIGLARITGLAHVKIDVEHEEHMFADIDIANQSQLKTYGGGSAKIVWKQAGEGNGKWAIVEMQAQGGELMQVVITGSGIVNGEGWYEAEEIIKQGSGVDYTSHPNGAQFNFGAGTSSLGEVYHPNGTTGLEFGSGGSGIVTQVRRTSNQNGDPYWTIVGAGDNLPPGSGLYKVLQLDSTDEPHWDYVRMLDI